MTENDTTYFYQPMRQKELKKVDADIDLNRQKHEFEKRRWKAECYLEVSVLLVAVFGLQPGPQRDTSQYHKEP